MKNNFKKQLALRGSKFLNVAIISALICACWELYYIPRFKLDSQFPITVAIGLTYAIIFVLLCRVYGVFEVGALRITQLIYSQSLSLLLVDLLFYIIMTVASLETLNPVPLICTVIIQLLWTVLWSIMVNKLYFVISPPRKTAIIYHHKSELRKLEEIKHFSAKFHVIKHIRETNDVSAIINELDGVEVIFVTRLDLPTRDALLKYCVGHSIQCYIMPRVGDVLLGGADNMHTFSIPFMRVQRSSPKIEYLFVKRAFDIFASLLAIILTSPIMLVTALAIKLYDRGPVFYKQVRLTRGHKRFNVLKFRSMRTDAEKDGVARLSTEHDDRITPVGKIIRKVRIDELPQLFNILAGDMTIVGPRPERPEIAEQYEKDIPSFGLRLQVKAGLTGYAQVYGRYNTEPYDKLKMDLMYINNMSMWEDLHLMFATIKILFMAESTEGIADGQLTATYFEEEPEQEEQEKENQNV